MIKWTLLLVLLGTTSHDLQHKFKEGTIGTIGTIVYMLLVIAWAFALMVFG